MACVLSLAVASGGYSLVAVHGILIVVASLVVEHGLQGTWTSVVARGLSVWVQKLPITGSRAQAQSLWCMGLVSLWHVVSSQTRDRTRVSCIDRWITNHWTTREAPAFEFREDTIQSTIPAAWKIWDAESNRHLWAETLHSSCWIFLAGVKVSTILGWGGHMDISHRFLLIWHV